MPSENSDSFTSYQFCSFISYSYLIVVARIASTVFEKSGGSDPASAAGSSLGGWA